MPGTKPHICMSRLVMSLKLAKNQNKTLCCVSSSHCLQQGTRGYIIQHILEHLLNLITLITTVIYLTLLILIMLQCFCKNKKDFQQKNILENDKSAANIMTMAYACSCVYSGVMLYCKNKINILVREFFMAPRIDITPLCYH